MTASAIWTPSQQRIANSNMQDFLLQANALAMQQVPAKEITDYAQLHQWSIDQPALFWSLVWQDSQLVPALEKPIDDSEQLKHILRTGKEFYDAQWFSQLKINFAENLLQRRDDAIALISCGEPSLNQGQDRSMSYKVLYAQVAQLAHSLKAMGIVQGDRVAAFMPNTQETVIAMLATTSIGAIWSSCSPDFGLQGVIDRFGQIEPKVLFTTDGYFYGGKTLDSLPKVEQICKQLNGLEHVIVIPHISLGSSLASSLENTAKFELPLIKNIAVQSWQEALDNDCEEIHFNRLPFDHPLYIMYSSGTTGVPKCIVHSAGGTLIQHAKELRLHTDVKPEDTIFYYSTCGWMMWNWLVSSLSIGATVVLYDGSPFYPDGHYLWLMAERHKVSIF
ncbi:MAG: AMP-binding protein, partial [Oleispira sp.]|nr:AMP-binding protein [Oleispira sp.]